LRSTEAWKVWSAFQNASTRSSNSGKTGLDGMLVDVFPELVEGLPELVEGPQVALG
jgi:hypothetical protein